MSNRCHTCFRKMGFWSIQLLQLISDHYFRLSNDRQWHSLIHEQDVSLQLISKSNPNKIVFQLSTPELAEYQFRRATLQRIFHPLSYAITWEVSFPMIQLNTCRPSSSTNAQVDALEKIDFDAKWETHGVYLYT